jgi:hypothetical protein
MKLFRNESGFALPLALLVMVTTSAILVTAIKTTSSTGRTANLGKTAVSAEALAEAGLANGVSILAKPGQNTNTQALFPSTEATATVYTMENGTAKLWGVYNTVTNVWTLYAKGSMPNPTGGAPITKTLSRTASVLGIAAGATVPEWSRFLYDDASSCFTIDTVTIPGSVASRGPMCLRNGGNVAVNTTGAATTVAVGTNLTVEAPNVTSPARTSPSTAGAVTGTGWTNALYNYLSTSDGNRATYSIPCCNALSNNLDAKGMFNSPAGNNIPTTAIIRGIQVDIIRNASSTSSLRDEDVFLLKAGSATGSDHADTGTDWGTADFNATYGGPTDLWGTTWTPAEINATNFGVRLRIKNRHGSSARTASINQIRVTVTYTGAATTPAIGASGSPILKADIVGTCKLNNNPTAACDSNRGVWATTVTNTLTPPLVKPQIDLDWWWRNAKPGPMHPCTEPGNTFPNGFDTNAGATSGNAFAPDNSVNTSAEITPMNASYTCQVKENGVLVGEISWNNATHVLKVQGTIYIDGDIRFDDNGQIVHYQGRAIIYASDDIEFDERVCAGGSGMTNCAATPATMAAWTPSTDLLTILAGDLSTSQPCCPTLENAEFDHSTQGSNSAQGDDPAAPGAFQGIVYAKGNCQIHEFFKLSGPVICNRITIDEGQEPGNYPTISAFPPLGSLVDGSIYLNPDNAGTFSMTLGPQTG